MNIDCKDFMHPLDEAARAHLEALPGFQKVLEWYMEIGLERLTHGLSMANCIRLSPTQLPEIYNRLPPICQKFGINEPEFYLTMNPTPNAWTTGDNQTFLTITSGLVELLKTEELDAVIAHECGHIICRHVLYHSMGRTLANWSAYIPLAKTLMQPIIQGLFYWMRKSELSADRASCVFYGNTDVTTHALIRLAGGPASITEKINFEEYAKQAEGYDEHLKSTWNKFLQNLSIMDQDHPYWAVRVNELLKWEKTEEFKNLKHNMRTKRKFQCFRCGRLIDASSNFCTYCGEKLK